MVGMAYTASKAQLRQSALKAAAEVVAAGVSAGLFSDIALAEAEVESLRDRLFNDLSAVDDANPAPKSNSGGGRRGGGGKPTLEGALNMVMNSGPFKGEKLGDIIKFTADEASDGFKYTRGSGEDYVKWVASEHPNDFVKQRAAIVVESLSAVGAEAATADAGAPAGGEGDGEKWGV